MWYIVRDDLFLHSDIDSSGMSVCWTTQREHADSFDEKWLASRFANRVKDRYPNEKIEVKWLGK